MESGPLRCIITGNYRTSETRSIFDRPWLRARVQECRGSPNRNGQSPQCNIWRRRALRNNSSSMAGKKQRSAGRRTDAAGARNPKQSPKEDCRERYRKPAPRKIESPKAEPSRQGRKASLPVAALLIIWGSAIESWKIAMSYEPVSQRRVRISILIALIIIGATRAYYVREMLAALIIFSALFALVAAIILILFLIWFLLDRASQLALGWIEARAKSFSRAALRLLPARSRV